ncbi:nickel-responsive transcriptional regulator NikR [candidate division KSB1 bacterium]|nr:nickel-responsive transcriptional regulator NikR [candidate division KSB1 bacterium]
MSYLIRFGISIEASLLDQFDKHIQAHAYRNRSEAIRDLIRKELIQERCLKSQEEALGTITLMYDHHVRELPQLLTEIQHQFNAYIISSMHVHLDEHNCLEVLAVKGQPPVLQRLADQLISTKGVKHGNLAMTSMMSGE